MDASFDSNKVPRNMTNVQVVVRCRPASADERARGVHETVHCDTLAQEVRVALNKVGEKVFTYDRVYDPHSSQRQIYEDSVEPLVQQTLRGYNTTVLAYGQTGTGKTHTMEGEFEDPDEMGVIPRAMQSVFRTLESRGDTESYVKASYLEIYNENLTDLLSTAPTADVPANQQLRIVEDKSKIGRGVVVHNLEEVLVKSWEDIRRVMKLAMSKRRIAATELNERSSRSHAVFTVTVHSKEFSPEGEELLRVGKINLVDLAGSECVARSGSKDQRAREAGSINQSLLTLGRVITALVEKSPHIAYRDSKLTRLLQESLGGCSLTLMIATVAPSVHCLDETLSTLEYASRAKAIKNRPMANQKMTKRVAIREYVEEIERLRIELQAARSKDGVFLPEQEYNQLVNSGKSSSVRVLDLEASLDKRVQELSETRAMYSQTSSELKKTVVELDAERDRLQRTKDDLKRKERELDEERQVSEERQAVVDAHVTVESRLHLVHDELQERLRFAKDRLNSLHEKVDRKQHVERENERLVGDLRQQVDRKLIELEETVRDGKSLAFEGVDKVQILLERFHRFLAEDVQQSHQTHRERYVETFQVCLDRTNVSNSKNVDTDAARVGKEGACNAQGFAEAAENFVQATRAHEDTMQETRRAHVEETIHLREWCVLPLVAELERTRISSTAFADSLQQVTVQIKQATEALVGEYESKLAAMQAEMRRMVAEEKQRSKRASDKALEKMSLVLAALQEDSEFELERMAGTMAQRTTSAVRAGRESVRAIGDCVDWVSASNENWFASEQDQKQNCLRDIRRKEQDLTETAKMAWEDIAERSEETIGYTRRGMSDCQAAKERVERSTLVVLQELRERSQTLQTENKSSRASVGDVHRQAMEEEQQMQARTQTMLVQTRKDLDAVKQGTEGFCSASIARLDDTKDVVGRFQLKEDRPTGKTPSKLQVFDWTKERPATSPHALIVEKFRRSRQQVVGDMEDLKKPKGARASLTERDENANEEADMDQMKVTDLKSALKDKGLSVKGDKQVLKQRLKRSSLGELTVDDQV